MSVSHKHIVVNSELSVDYDFERASGAGAWICRRSAGKSYSFVCLTEAEAKAIKSSRDAMYKRRYSRLIGNSNTMVMMMPTIVAMRNDRGPLFRVDVEVNETDELIVADPAYYDRPPTPKEAFGTIEASRSYDEAVDGIDGTIAIDDGYINDYTSEAEITVSCRLDRFCVWMLVKYLDHGRTETVHTDTGGLRTVEVTVPSCQVGDRFKIIFGSEETEWFEIRDHRKPQPKDMAVLTRVETTPSLGYYRVYGIFNTPEYTIFRVVGERSDGTWVSTTSASFPQGSYFENYFTVPKTLGYKSVRLEFGSFVSNEIKLEE